MKFKRLAPATAIMAVGVLTLSACGGTSATGEGGEGSAEGEQVSGDLVGIGASSQSAAMDAWIADFTSQQSGASIQYSPDGSGAGREQFLSGAANFAGSDAPLDEEELEQATEVCGPDGAFEFPVYISPIAVAYNLPGVDNLQLSPELVANIFKGEITNWNDQAIADENPDAELPDLAITAVHRSDESGTTLNFTEYLSATAGDTWGEEAAEAFPEAFGGEAAQGTANVVGTVQDTEGGITYADASATGELGVASIQVGEEYVELSPEAAAAVVDASEVEEGRAEGDLAFELARDTTESGAYPIVLVSYHLVCSTYEDQETVDLVKAWETFVISEEGQASAQESAGSAPISSELRDQITPIIDRIAVAG